jgi:hypothetical protein
VLSQGSVANPGGKRILSLKIHFPGFYLPSSVETDMPESYWIRRIFLFGDNGKAIAVPIEAGMVGAGTIPTIGGTGLEVKPGYGREFEIVGPLPQGEVITYQIEHYLPASTTKIPITNELTPPVGPHNASMSGISATAFLGTEIGVLRPPVWAGNGRLSLLWEAEVVTDTTIQVPYIHGDSTSAYSQGPFPAGIAWACEALRVPAITCAAPSSSLMSFISRDRSDYAGFRLGNVGIIRMGTNQWSTNAAAIVSTLRNRLRQFRKAGIARVLYCYPLPNTDAGNTTRANAAVQDAFYPLVPSIGFDGVFKAYNGSEGGGTAQPLLFAAGVDTTDGVHINSAGTIEAMSGVHAERKTAQEQLLALGLASPRRLDEPNRFNQIALFDFIKNPFCYSDTDASELTPGVPAVKSSTIRDCSGRLLSVTLNSAKLEAAATVGVRSLGGYELVGPLSNVTTYAQDRAYELGTSAMPVNDGYGSFTLAIVGRHIAGQKGVLFSTNWVAGYSTATVRLNLEFLATNDSLALRTAGTVRCQIDNVTGDFVALLQYNAVSTVWTLVVRRPGVADATTTFTGVGGLTTGSAGMRARLFSENDGTGQTLNIYGGALAFLAWEKNLEVERGSEALGRAWYLSELQRIAGF